MAIDPTTMCEILLGLGGVNLLEVVECQDDTIKVTIETREGRVPCPGCGSYAASKERRPARLTDLTCFGRKVILIWNKRRLKCLEPTCDISTFTEANPQIAGSNLRLTTRAAKWSVEQVGRLGRSVYEVSGDIGASWHAVNDAVIRLGRILVDDPGRIREVKAIGLDETLMMRRGKFKKQIYSTQIVDVERGQLLDIVPGRKADKPKRWLEERPDEWLHDIGYATLDLSGVYKSVYDEVIGHAVQIADPFHVVKTANSKLDECRRRVQNETLLHRGRKGDPLYRSRRLLSMAHERMDEDSAEALRTPCNRRSQRRRDDRLARQRSSEKPISAGRHYCSRRMAGGDLGRHEISR